MKLTTNKEHKKGSFKKQTRRVTIKLGALALSIGIFSGCLSTLVSYLTNLEKVVAVTENVRNSIYYHNEDFDTNNYYSYIEEKDENGLVSRIIDIDAPKIDELITEESLQKVSFLEIDLKENKDISILTKMSNLETVSIENPNLLTDEDIIILNQISVDKILLNYSIEDILKINVNNNNLKNLKTNTKILVTYADELEEQIVYTFLKNLPGNFSCDNLDYEKLDKLNDKLDLLIGEIDFTNAVSESDKAMKILEKVLSYIKYDEDILIYLENHDYVEEGSFIDNKVTYYNDFFLSSVLDTEQEEAYGVCANYSALFTIMCYKQGIESHYIYGNVAGSDLAHAWNLIKVDGEYKYVDLTNLDPNYFDSVWYEMYLLGGNRSYPKEFYWDIIKKNTYMTLSESNLISEVDVERIKADLTRNPVIVFYNEDIAGTYVNNSGIDLTLPIIISLGSGLIVAVTGGIVIKRKEEKGRS